MTSDHITNDWDYPPSPTHICSQAKLIVNNVLHLEVRYGIYMQMCITDIICILLILCQDSFNLIQLQ